MTKDEALDLALEALEELNNTNSHWWQEVDATTIAKIDPAIAAIKQALANEALDKMAENARELGLDYEPAPVLYQLPDDLYDSKDWKVGSYAERVEWLHTMYEAKKRELEYCLDAAPVQEPDWSHPKIQALIGADARNRITIDLIWRILENPNGEYTASDMEYWGAIHDAVQAAAQRQWVGLTDGEILGLAIDADDLGTGHIGFAHAIENKLKEKNK